MSTQWLQNSFDHIIKDSPSPWRQMAWDQFQQMGFPTQSDEAWKYTDVSVIANTAFSAPSHLTDVTIRLPEKLPNTYRLVFINGFFSKSYSDICDDVIVEPLLDAIEKDHLDAAFSFDVDSAFLSLNKALFQDGCYIRVKKSAVISKPIHLLHIQTHSDRAPMQSLHHFVQADENSQFSLFEEYCCVAGVDITYFNNVCTQIHANKGARVTHYRLQNEHQLAYHIGTVQIHQHADSSVDTYHFNVGGRIARHDLHYALQEKGAHAKIIGLYCANGQQHLDSHTQVNHVASHCTSEQLYRGVMSDQSHAVFNGKILVKPNAQKTQAYLNNRNLLLSKNAQVDTKPELEIYADDVKCAHGATVGCIDPNALFYLRSRGIDQLTAERLLIQAFIAELIEMLPHPDIQSYIASVIMNEF